MNEVVNGIKPVVLLLGEIVLAHKEWDALRAIAQLRQVSEGSRDQFLRDCNEGVYDGVFAISRTFDSTQITGRFDPELVSLLPRTVKFISHNGAGYDSIDATACAERGISVSNTPGAVDASTASTTIYLLLGALRRSYIPCTALRAGRWRGRMQLTHDPENKVLGILGMGGIGTAVARRAVGFGMTIQYHNRRQLPADKNPVGAKYVEFEDLLRTSDIVSLHLPLNDRTRGLIGRREFAMMKEGVVFVNTARGPIVDEQALVEALESGHVWGAGLDVYEKEPVVHDGLLRSEHCVLMPHVGTATMETQRKMEILVMENLRSAIAEHRLLTPVAETQAMLAEQTAPNGREPATVNGKSELKTVPGAGARDTHTSSVNGTEGSAKREDTNGVRDHHPVISGGDTTGQANGLPRDGLEANGGSPGTAGIGEHHVKESSSNFSDRQECLLPAAHSIHAGYQEVEGA